MIDLLLVDPPVDFSVRLGKLARAGSFFPSLGLLSLAAVVRKEGFTVTVFDANLAGGSLGDMKKHILASGPRWVGLSATTLTIETVGTLAAAIKRTSPGVVTMVGGPHMTAVPRETLQRYPGIDIGLIGEGEETIGELLKTLAVGKTLSEVAGIIYRRGSQLSLTSPRPFIAHLDDLPDPAWDLLPEFPHGYRPALNSYRQLPAAHLMTSRGCTGMCVFCDRSVFGRVPRAFSAERIVHLVGRLVEEYGIREIQFFDDNLMLFPERLETVCREFIRRQWGISWSCQARADMVNPKLLKLMKEAGCWQIGLGVESGSDRILKLMKKNETSGQIRQAVESIDRSGIEAKGYFILGNLGETRKSLAETERFILSTPFSWIHTTFFTPYPGSEAYGLASEYGRFDNKDNWAELGQGTIGLVFVPRGLTKKELRLWAKRIFRRFYFRPKFFYDRWSQVVRQPRLLPAYIQGLGAVVRFVQ